MIPAGSAPAPKGDHDQIMRTMLQDRQLTHGRLLLGMAVVELHRQHGEARWKDAARFAVGNDPRYLACYEVELGGERTKMSEGGYLGWLHDMIRKDRPRYEAPIGRHDDLRWTCQVPTPRKPACGKSQGWGVAFMEPDPQTGELIPRVFCHRHREIGYALSREIGARPAAPEPAANRGGILARYIDTDWEALYQWVDPDWTMPPSGPVQPVTPAPRLQVLVTDEPDYVPAPGGGRAPLALVRPGDL
jgi:hypothetical protein